MDIFITLLLPHILMAPFGARLPRRTVGAIGTRLDPQPGYIRDAFAGIHQILRLRYYVKHCAMAMAVFYARVRVRTE